MEGTMTTTKFVLAALTMAPSVPALADGQSLPLTAGARVRVTAASADLDKQVATIAEVRGDSIVLDVDGLAHPVAISDLQRLEVSIGKRTRVTRDAGIGAAIGFAAGALIGAASYEECVPQSFLDCFMVPGSRGDAALLGGAAGGTVGLVLGALVGMGDRTDRWQALTLPVQAAVTSSHAGGASVRMSVAF